MGASGGHYNKHLFKFAALALFSVLVMLNLVVILIILLGGIMRTFEVNSIRAALLVAILIFFGPVLPQNVSAQENTGATLESIKIPAGTTVQLEFVETMSSATSKTGQTFALRLREPIMIDGRPVVPAGTMGGGEVIDASRSGIGGRSGKLILSGRFIEFQGQRVRIRGLQSLLAGTDRSRTVVNATILVPQVGFLVGFIQGGDIVVPVGTAATAQLATDLIVSVPAQPIQTETPVNPEPSSTNPKGEK
jgi:hypothetical protein